MSKYNQQNKFHNIYESPSSIKPERVISKKTGKTVEPDFKNRHANKWTGILNDETIEDKIVNQIDASQVETAWKLHMTKFVFETENCTEAIII